MKLADGLKHVLSGKAFKLVAGQERRKLLLGFWFAASLLLFIALPQVVEKPFEVTVGAGLIFLAAMFPAYLWCKGKALGIPIFPVFALTHIWTCVIPIYNEQQRVGLYSPAEQLFACSTIAGFLLLGTAVWYSIIRTVKSENRDYRALKGKAAENFFLCSFAASTFFMIGAIGGWFYFISTGAFSLIRGSLLGLNSLATFILAYRWGRHEISKEKTILYVLVLAGYMLSTASSLLIVTAISTFALAAIGFSIGRRRIPALAIALAIVFLGTLHYGKAQMRSKYFGQQAGGLVQPWDYPAWFSEWFGYSMESLITDSPEEGNVDSLLDRTGTIHIFLMVQQQTSLGTPLLYGETYAVVPRLLVPRLLDPDKPISHEGTSILNIHYGLQTLEGTASTTIGWGLLNEAYANFGLLGVLGLAVILGAFYGVVTRWSMNTPILSARSLFAIILLNLALQSEFAASVYVTVLFQALVSLGVVAFLFMRSRDARPASKPVAIYNNV